MSFVARNFLRAGVGFALVGMGLGIVMGARHDFTLVPVHAHVNLLGWVSMVLYALVYRALPGAAVGWAPLVHFWSALAGLLVMAPGIALIVNGSPLGEPLAIGGSILTFASMLVFGSIVLRATAARADDEAGTRQLGNRRLAPQGA